MVLGPIDAACSRRRDTVGRGILFAGQTEAELPPPAGLQTSALADASAIRMGSGSEVCKRAAPGLASSEQSRFIVKFEVISHGLAGQWPQSGE